MIDVIEAMTYDCRATDPGEYPSTRVSLGNSVRAFSLIY